MIVHPEKYVQRFARAGAGMLTFHFEAAENPQQVIDLIRAEGIKVGITINPDVPVSALEPYIAQVDMVLLMTVFAGYGGQKFIEESYERINELKQLTNRLNPACLIEVDGGVGINNARKLFDHGVNVLVAGSSVFNTPDPAETIKTLLNA
jgi:ribulose-phosphate 3-epimerase